MICHVLYRNQTRGWPRPGHAAILRRRWDRDRGVLLIMCPSFAVHLLFLIDGAWRLLVAVTQYPLLQVLFAVYQYARPTQQNPSGRNPEPFRVRDHSGSVLYCIVLFLLVECSMCGVVALEAL